MGDDKALLNQLKKVRRSRKITIGEMADAIGISRELMGKYERGESDVRWKVLKMWTDLLGVKLVLREEVEV